MLGWLQFGICAWLLVEGAGEVWAARSLWVSWSSLHRLSFQGKGELRVLTFGDLSGFCPVGPVLHGAMLLLESRRLPPPWPGADPMTSEEDTGV